MEGDIPGEKDPLPEVVDEKARAMATAAAFTLIELVSVLGKTNAFDSTIFLEQLGGVEKRMRDGGYERGAEAAKELRMALQGPARGI